MKLGISKLGLDDRLFLAANAVFMSHSGIVERTVEVKNVLEAKITKEGHSSLGNFSGTRYSIDVETNKGRAYLAVLVTSRGKMNFDPSYN